MDPVFIAETLRARIARYEERAADWRTHPVDPLGLAPQLVSRYEGMAAAIRELALDLEIELSDPTTDEEAA